MLHTMILECGDEIVKKIMFESVSTQMMMMMCGDEIFPCERFSEWFIEEIY